MNSVRSRALVMVAPGEPLEYCTDVTVDPPKSGEVRVRIQIAGICHSDLATLDGTFPAVAPMVLGHEGAGVVEAVGPDVDGLGVGDRVVMTNSVQCRLCHQCLRTRPHLCEAALLARTTGGLLDGTHRSHWRGRGLAQLALSGTFADHTVVPAASAIRIPADVSATAAALVSCAALTGVGAALHTAHIRAGDTVAVLGCGGVGLNILQGARLAGAGQIIGIDADPGKQPVTAQFGATHFIDARTDPVEGVRAITNGRGVDWVFDVVGNSKSIRQSIDTAGRGGTVILVGIPDPRLNIEVTVFPTLIAQDKTLRGSWYGSSDVARDVPMILHRYRAGELLLDELVSRTITLEEAVDVVSGRSGTQGIRTMIDLEGA